ncbi:hypothetical protein OKW21_006625 [Catalinimonas alkaloidigena]|uniref:hypothetical protein n=1 Tax=Catalinimonas alkaloidigena TaxID=1075417 RepID=UPI002405CA74|nr:hypothetical protein [Catalinimonas alkaloidigena]MDF9801316.1 hypothetical protein [Catalinimonas alkaloidigena]
MEKIKDYNRAFRTMKAVTLVSILGFISATVIYYFQYKQLVDTKNDQVYVVTDNGTLSAYLTEERDVTPFESKYLSEIFIKSMFAHDAETYDRHLDDALHLVDEPSGLMVVEQFDKGKVKDNYIRWGSRTEVFIDSVKILSNGLPAQARAYFKQRHYIGSELKTELAIALKYNIVKTYRNEQNPFGLQIADLDFVPYNQYKSENE